MKSRLLALALCVLLLPVAHADQPAATASAQAVKRPLLWMVSDADNSVYLLGSFHLLKADDYPLPVEVDRAFDDSASLLFEIDPATGLTSAVDLGGYALTNGDGLEVGSVGRTVQVFVVRNRSNLVADLRLDRDLSEGTLARELGDDDFDVPTTVARVKDALYAVNARFGTPPTPTTDYDVVRVGLR